MFDQLKIGLGITGAIAAGVLYFYITGLQADLEKERDARERAEALNEMRGFTTQLDDHLSTKLDEDQKDTDENAEEEISKLENDLRELNNQLEQALADKQMELDDEEYEKLLEQSETVRKEHSTAVTERISDGLWSFYCRENQNHRNCTE